MTRVENEPLALSVEEKHLANLGKMMLEMVHEFNNPLSGLSMSIQLMELSVKRLKKTLAADSIDTAACLSCITQIQTELKNMHRSTNRAAGLRESLIHYAKPHHLNLKPYHPDKLITSVLTPILRHPQFKKMMIHQDYATDLPLIAVDSAKFEQIVYNLLNNARDAAGESAVVTIRSYVAEPDNVCIEIADNGPGIAHDLRDKLFSPFLSTKPMQGLGLGLSISQRIMQQHGGALLGNNSHQGGACFKLLFPVGADMLWRGK